jgi:inward rectifier potassium channel
VDVSLYEASFFFSVHTLSTIGYGSISPNSNYLHFWVVVEATMSLIIVTLMTGISWSNFARPRAHILFSSKILITRLYGHRCLVFRAANTRHHGDIRESSFRIGVLLTNHKTGLRHLYNVPLVTSEWPSFTLSTTLIHVIDEKSPFSKVHSEEDIQNYRVAVITLFTGLDTTFSESVYARKMYFWDDLFLICILKTMSRFLPRA